MHDELAVGRHGGVGGPRNNFPLVPSARYLFVAGGIGITPLLPMIRQAELLGADWTLLYGGRTRASMAFLDELAAHGDRVHVVPQDERGLLDLPRWLGDPRTDTVVYCCGPAPLLAAVERRSPAPTGARTRCAPSGSSPTEPARPSGTRRSTVELARTGATGHRHPADARCSRPSATAGVDVLSSCRQGTCGTCETDVLDGVPDHRDSILDDARARRRATACSSACPASRTDRLVLDL